MKHPSHGKAVDEGVDIAAAEPEGKPMASTATSTGKTAQAGGTGRRERNKLEKRKRIVEAARRLFADRGFSETTTLQIAEAADIGTGTLFLYARSKEDLLVMVFEEEMLATAKKAFSDLPTEMPLVDQILQVFERMVAYHERDLALARLLLKEILMPDRQERADELTNLMNAIYDGFGRLVMAAQAKGELSERFEPDLMGQSFFGLYYLGLLTWLGGMTKRDAFFARLRQQLELFLDCA